MTELNSTYSFIYFLFTSIGCLHFAITQYKGYLLGGKGGWCIVLTTVQNVYSDYLKILGALTL